MSCGVFEGAPVLDLDYAEDSEADTDANFVMTGAGRIVEVQGTAEKIPFSEEELLKLLALAKKGVGKLVERGIALAEFFGLGEQGKFHGILYLRY